MLLKGGAFVFKLEGISIAVVTLPASNNAWLDPTSRPLLYMLITPIPSNPTLESHNLLKGVEDVRALEVAQRAAIAVDREF